MRRAAVLAALAIGVLVAVPGPVLASLPIVEFSSPAQANGDLLVTNATWALIVFRPTSAAHFQADVQPESTTNHSTVFADTYRPGTANGSVPYPIITPSEPLHGELRSGISFDGAWASLYIEASSIRVQATNTQSELKLPGGHMQFSEFLPDRWMPEGVYDEAIPPSGLLWAIQAPEQSANFGTNLEIKDVHRLEWHNATVACQSDRKSVV